MNPLLDSPLLAALAEAAKHTHALLIEELWDGPKAAVIALLRQATERNILVITSDKTENRLAQNLDYFNLNHFEEFPAWDTLPGEDIPPSLDIVGRRFEILHNLMTKKGPHLVLCPLQACLQKLPSKQLLQQSCHLFRIGQEIPFELLDSTLEALGYRKEPVVSDKGHFAIRRGIVDLFPLSAAEPVRIEFFGDEIASMRTFDPVGQKSIHTIEEVFICPASEPRMLAEAETLASFFDYMDKQTLIIFDDLLDIEDRYVALKGLAGASSRFFFTIEELLDQLEAHPHLYLTKQPLEQLGRVEIERRLGRDFYSGKTPIQPLAFELFGKTIRAGKARHPFVPIPEYFSASSKEEIFSGIDRLAKTPLTLVLLTSTESEEKTLRSRIEEGGVTLPHRTRFERGYLSSGFAVSDAALAIVPMTELTGRRRVRRQKWRGTYHTPAAEFHELRPGDLVVHFHNGIGKYLGTEKKKNHLGHLAEFLVIEYDKNSKLYVPLASSHLVSRYIGASDEVPTLNNLSTKKWQTARQRAQKAIIGYAEQLLRKNAEREIAGGYVFPADTQEMLQFESDFPFVETDDQLISIAAIKQDMTSAKAMDRLICGDVGYGKTEVAMRAAFKAAVDGGKQVAILVPTTVLAMQHFEAFCERMANYPIQIGVVSRFIPPKVVQQTLAQAQSGALDILIGTHRIASKDVAFKDLGLIIIDEEQRFGVRVKERLKQLKAGVDCLTLSATPIPRTLYLSLIGGRDMSVINTPPQDRLPIKSHIVERNEETIRHALIRELSRQGQAFYIHNRVETIYQTAEELQKIVPEARIVVAHGQMSSHELDKVYHLFKNGQADILVATTIIENGIDIPNTNTILIDRADQFGLASLYQLLGRVGRWNRPAYCYFLIPYKRELQELTRKRLSALTDLTGYGGGMKIAMRDLEIRGAGDILGTKQSGQISSIGFHLYCKLLKKTIDAMKRKQAPSFIETKMEFLFDACLPEEYIAETSLRMELYHRLGEASCDADTDLILSEMKDRFGEPPPPAIWLYHLTRIRIHAQALNFTLLKFERFTFTGERKCAKETIRQTVPMPKTREPKEFEEALKQLLGAVG